MLRRLEIEELRVDRARLTSNSTAVQRFSRAKPAPGRRCCSARWTSRSARAPVPTPCAAARAKRRSSRLTFDPSDAVRERLVADGYELDPGEEAAIVTRDQRRRAFQRAASTDARRPPLTFATIGRTIAEIVGQHEAQRLLSPAVPSASCSTVSAATSPRAREPSPRAFERLAEERTARWKRLRADERARARPLRRCAFSPRGRSSGAPEPPAKKNASTNGAAISTTPQRDRRSPVCGRAIALAGDDSGAIASARRGGSHRSAAIAEFRRRFARWREHAAGAAKRSRTNSRRPSLRARGAAISIPPSSMRSTRGWNSLDGSKRKYGGESSSACSSTRTSARCDVEAYEGRDRRDRANCGASRTTPEAALAGRCRNTHARRERRAAAALAKRVAAELGDLALGSGRF